MEIPRRILKGIKILPPGRKTHIYESVRDLSTLEFQFTLLYICLSIYLYTYIKVGQGLYLTTLKLYQFNKTKVLSCSYHNPIRMFLFRKPSTWTFHFVLSPFSRPLGFSPLSQQLGEEDLGKAHQRLNYFGLEMTEITSLHITLAKTIQYVYIQVKRRPENTSCVSGGNEKGFDDYIIVSVPLPSSLSPSFSSSFYLLCRRNTAKQLGMQS